LLSRIFIRSRRSPKRACELFVGGFHTFIIGIGFFKRKLPIVNGSKGRLLWFEVSSLSRSCRSRSLAHAIIFYIAGTHRLMILQSGFADHHIILLLLLLLSLLHVCFLEALLG
jgi:hypothetical protein